jgi:hypothetical protein
LEDTPVGQTLPSQAPVGERLRQEWTLYDPTGVPKHGAGALARRASSLTDSTIGLLWNSKPNGEVLLELIGQRLAEKYSSVRFINIKKPSAGQPISQTMLEALLECHGVITTLGD